MGLPSQGRASGAGMRVSSRVKRPKGLPPAVIPIVVVGLAIAAVWGGYSLLEPSGADAGEEFAGETGTNANAASKPGTDRAGRPEAAAARNDDGALNTGIESLTSNATNSNKRGLLGEALEGGREAPTASANRSPAGTRGAETSNTPEFGPLPDSGTPVAAASTAPSLGDGAIVDPVASGRPAATTSSRASTAVIEQAKGLIAQNELLDARTLMSRALADPSTTPAGRQALRDELTGLNETLVFGPRIIPGDPMVEEYTIASGDTLGRITRRRELGVHWKLVQRVNRISRPERIRVGQKIKLVRGPFHAVVDKSEYRVDIYHGPPSEPARWVYITSRTVGLGEAGSTPTGTFVVRQDSKLENPAWVNPRDGREQYGRDDPENPIGEHWIGLEGVGDAAAIEGYGLHGTIDPGSIGKQKSMGCVRLLADDIALMYELLEEGASVVKIVP